MPPARPATSPPLRFIAWPAICHRDLTHASSGAFSGYRWPPDVIVTAVRWYLSYPLSARQLTELLGKRGIDVSARTVLTWTKPSVHSSRPRPGGIVVGLAAAGTSTRCRRAKLNPARSATQSRCSN
jgi:hypothetical protein